MVDLFCEGRGDRFVDGSRSQVATAVRFKIAGTAGQTLVPDDLLAGVGARGWHDLKNRKMSPDRIEGKITLSWIFAPPPATW